jgi:cardiolipin synthase A/B
MSGNRSSTATSLKVLVDREAEWTVRMEMVNRAQRFLILTTYYFGSDERSGWMADALLAASRRGVRVVLVLDRFGQRLAQNLGSPAEHRKLRERFRELRAAGGLIVHCSPRSLRHRWVGGGMHVKIQVSEAGVAVFGSSNIAHHSFCRWNEVSLEIEGEIVADLLQEACRFAGMTEQQSATFRAWLPAAPSAEPIQLRYVREDPEERSGRLFPFGAVDNRLTAELVELIDRAQRSLCITSFYYKPAPMLKAALLRACGRGVDVEIFHSHRDSLEVSQLPWIPSSIQYASIMRAGARIYENRAGEHSKVILVDDREVSVGSYNLEHAAHDRLVEAMIFSDDVALCECFRSFFDTLRRSPDNTALSSEWLSELPFGLQIKRWLYRPLQRWI